MLRALLALSVAGVLLVPSGAVAKPSACGKADSGFETAITASGGVTCTKARLVAREWHKQVAGVEKSPKRLLHFGPFICTGRNGADSEHFKITCTHHAQTIRFVAGP